MISIATIAYNDPRLISEQIRLLRENLRDPYSLYVFDNSSTAIVADDIARVCASRETVYCRLTTRMHHEGLNVAAQLLPDDPFIGFLDHDIFPVRETRIIPHLTTTGFYGVGQRHPATGHLYLWPGFCFFSRKWLAGRPLDFTGYRDGDKRNDGDTGSSLWPLFEKEDWHNLYKLEHSYGVIRKPDGYGLQSFGYERLGDWLHFSNASKWMSVPNPEERERLLFDLLK